MSTFSLHSAAAATSPSTVGRRALQGVAAIWLAVALLGQALFAAYVTVFYGGAALAGDPARWNQVMPHGHVPGDTAGNTVLGLHLGISLNALLILLFAGLALHAARGRRIDAHRRWALRLYLAVLGVWFFRLGLTLWLLIHRAPVGFDPKTFAGPFLTALSFAQTLIPLLLLELFLRAQRSLRPGMQTAAAGGLGLLSLATLAGTGTAYLMLWRPHF